MIDPVTRWFEVAALQDNPNANEIQRLFDSYWLARYPRPVEIGFDNGSEFKMEFLRSLQEHGPHQEDQPSVESPIQLHP